MESNVIPFQFHPIHDFDETKHIVDVVAKEYLEKATGEIRHLIPVDVLADGNCLYHSIVVLIRGGTFTLLFLYVNKVK